MTTTNGAKKSGLGATRAPASSTETGGALPTARRRWMEAECAYRAMAARGFAVDQGLKEILRQLRDLAKAAEDAYCEALAGADTRERQGGNVSVAGSR